MPSKSKKAQRNLKPKARKAKKPRKPLPATTENNIRNWRLFRNITSQGDLSDLTYKVPGCRGLTRPTINRLESGRMEYSQQQVKVIARALRCTEGDLISVNPYASGDIFRIYAGLGQNDKRAVDTFLRSLAPKLPGE